MLTQIFLEKDAVKRCFSEMLTDREVALILVILGDSQLFSKNGGAKGVTLAHF